MAATNYFSPGNRPIHYLTLRQIELLLGSCIGRFCRKSFLKKFQEPRDRNQINVKCKIQNKKCFTFYIFNYLELDLGTSYSRLNNFKVPFILPVRHCFQVLPPFPFSRLRKMFNKFFAEQFPGNLRGLHLPRRVNQSGRQNSV